LSKEKTDKFEITFDSEVYIVEEEIISSIMNNPLFQARDQFFLKTFGLFITRQYLTQKQIKQATGFSIGKVSEEVNNLLEMGMIQVAHTSKYGKITYEASHAGILLLSYIKNVLDKIAKWQIKLKEMKEELEEKKEDLQDLHGYQIIYEKIVLYLQIITKYDKIVDKVEHGINELKE